MPGHEHEDFARIQPPLEGRLVRLRAIEEADLPGMNEMFTDVEVLRHIESVVFPQPVALTRQWWLGTRGDPTVFAFAIETLAGELCGACDLRQVGGRSRAAMIGLWIGRPFWNRGFGTDAVRTLCRFGFREVNLRRIGLDVLDTNPRGLRAYEKAGFRIEGRLRQAHFVDGRHVDILVMGVLAEELTEA
jgi:RimJ/RimL family protein N-acetyltransferase